MRVRINGEWQDKADGLSVAQLLEELGLPPRRVAVERNREIVRRVDFAASALAEDDQIEIVTLVGGG